MRRTLEQDEIDALFSKAQAARRASSRDAAQKVESWTCKAPTNSRPIKQPRSPRYMSLWLGVSAVRWARICVSPSK
jgi:hypothetical protein